MKTVWLIGRFDLPDASELADELAVVLPQAAFIRVESPHHTHPADAASPDLIIVVQHWPGEYSRRHAESLIASEPLAEFVVALGPWCGSTMRSERIWPESAVLPLWNVAPRIHRLIEVHDGHRCRLPLTASRDEAVHFDLESPQPTGRPMAASIVTPDDTFREMVAELCREMGVEVLPLGDAAEATVILWDITTVEPASEPFLQIRDAGCRNIAMIANPTIAEKVRLRKAGAHAVLPKPFSFSDLLTALRHTA